MNKRIRILLAGSAAVLAACLATAALAPAGAVAAPAPQTLWEGCENGSGAGQCRLPRGIVADPDSGHLFVVEQGNDRIFELTAWGEFVKAWGWGVLDGSEELQVCTGASGCQAGTKGGGPGQLVRPQGIARDSAGDLYVDSGEFSGRRLQKFTAAGEFVWMAGGGVNKTRVEEPGSTEAQRNLCTAASGDECQAATEGGGNGQFGEWLEGNRVAVGPGDEIYVGDEGRIQRFDTGGNYLGSIPLPGEEVQSLAADPSGNLFVALEGKDDVRKLDPSAPDPFAEPPCTAKVKAPSALATDPAGNLYVAAGSVFGGETVTLRKFSPTCVEDASFAFSDGFDVSTGLAVNTVTAGGGLALYVANSNFNDSYLRAYFPAPDKWPPPQVPPAIGTQYVTSVGTDGASLRAQINPLFWADASYYLEYGTAPCALGGCLKAPASPSQLGAGAISTVVTTPPVTLSGLEAATTYHYRFVTQSSGGGPNVGPEKTFTTFPAPVAAPPCANDAFRTAASARLPGCRAYELVSPLDKNGADVAIPGFYAWSPLAESSADGQRATFSAFAAFGEPEAAPLISQYLSERTASGWQTRSIAAPRRGVPIYGPSEVGPFKAFSEDLCSAWMIHDSYFDLMPGAPSGVANLYRRQNCGTESFELISTVDPPGIGPGEFKPAGYVPAPMGFSEDHSRTVFRAPGKLTPEACGIAGINQVYLYSRGEPLRLVSALPPDKGGGPICTYSSAGTMGGFPDGVRQASVLNALSADGTRVFWSNTGETELSDRLPIGANRTGKLYVRLNADQAPSKIAAGKCSEAGKACTVAISAAADTHFWGADEEGTKAIYATAGKLLEFDVASGQSQQLATGVDGVLGTSEDLSRIYFLSKDVLSGAQQNSEGDAAAAGKPNLYLSDEGDVIFLATLARNEGERNTQAGNSVAIRPGAMWPMLRTSRVSPDGLHVAFATQASPTGADNTDVVSGEPDAQVYLYEADPGAGAGELRCVSCNPTGARPRGHEVAKETSGTVPVWAAATLPGWAEMMRPSRLLGADGDHLFFHSFDALVLRDTNGKMDAYEWQRAADQAACEAIGAEVFSAEAEGCLSLISSGQSPQDSELVDASTSGADVFFTTASGLLPQDPGLIDVYDARIGGGYPQPVVPVACEGEACQGPYEPPQDPTPASSSFQGAGNVRETSAKPRCAKPKVKRKGRCVKPSKKKQKQKQRANAKRRAGR